MARMRRVVIESPYAGHVAINVAYAMRAVRDCIERGEAPIASHLLFTQRGLYHDSAKEERDTCMRAGHVWIPVADSVVVYEDYGVTAGMEIGIGVAREHEILIEYRKIGR